MPTLARAMTFSGLVMLAIAVVIGVAVAPVWGLAAVVVATCDFTLAFLFARGILGTPTAPPAPDATLGTDAEEYGTLADGTPVRADANPLVHDD